MSSPVATIQPPPDTSLSRGFRDVDATTCPERFTAYLDAVSRQLQRHKRLSYDLVGLQPGSRVLEVGCGTGDDARMLARRVLPDGHVTGIDVSARLVEEARARAAGTGLPVEFVVADAHHTGLPAGSYDAARVERCLQHVERPAAVIAEMARLVRRGGHIVAAEPDWDTLVVDATDRALTRDIAHILSDRRFAHGGAGRELAGLMSGAGLSDLVIRSVTLTTRSFALANEILLLGEAARDAWTTQAYSSGRISAWIEDLQERDRQGRFFAALTGFTVRGSVRAESVAI
jgi:SAM-dependent methyltransferase